MIEKLMRFQTGERFPILLGQDGIPVFYPNLYLLTMCRRKDAVNTMRARNRAIMHLYLWAEINKIDLEGRFKSKELLSIEEIESLCTSLLKELKFVKNYKSNKKLNLPRKITSLNFSMGIEKIKYVCSNTYNQRIMYVTAYIEWLLYVFLDKVERTSNLYISTMHAKDQMIKFINARKLTARYASDPRGLDDGVETKLLQIIDPKEEKNPFVRDFVKIRNQLYVKLALSTGLRRGEMLKIKVEHINLVTKKLSIKRSPDDILDKRVIEGNVKTNSRYVMIEDSLFKIIKDYLRFRSKLKKARSHPYLFVSQTGSALSYSSAGYIYIKIRENSSSMPDNLTQHEIRHEWNYKFSKSAKKKNLRDEKSDTLRKYLMGWSSNSSMPRRYDERSISEEASELSLIIQSDVMDSINENQKEEDNNEYIG